MKMTDFPVAQLLALYQKMLADYFNEPAEKAVNRAEEFEKEVKKKFVNEPGQMRLLIVVAVFLVFGLSSPLLAKLTPEMIKLVPGGKLLALIIPPPTIADAVAQYIKNLSQFGVLLALGIYQISRGNFMAPAWYTAFWYAFGVLTKTLIDRDRAE